MAGRNQYIDAVKGIAIILVVIGHAIQYTYAQFDDVLLYRIIYSFHMPLFIFISGLIVGKKYGTNSFDFNWIKKSFISLVVPFVAWSLIMSAAHASNLLEIGKDIIHTLIYPASGLWFLWILFLCHLVFFISERIGGCLHINKAILLGIWIMTAYAIYYGIGFSCFGINQLPWFIVFYAGGVFIGRFHCQRLCDKWIYFSLMAFIIYVFMIQFWRRNGISPLVSRINAPYIVVIFLNLLFRYVVAITGTILVFAIARLCTIIKNNFFSYAGMHTIEIYILHEATFNLVDTGKNGVDAIIKTILGLLLPIGVGYLLKTRNAERVLFGKYIR